MFVFFYVKSIIINLVLHTHLIESLYMFAYYTLIDLEQIVDIVSYIYTLTYFVLVHWYLLTPTWQIFQTKTIRLELTNMIDRDSKGPTRFCNYYPRHNYYPHRCNQHRFADMASEVIDKIPNNTRVYYKYHPQLEKKYLFRKT